MSKKKNYKEADSFIWNSIGGILNAGQSVVILMVITRTAGIAAAGIFSIAYATGNLFMNVGNYGVRNYQISDLSEIYSFYDYLKHRLLTIALMMILSVIYCIYGLTLGGYSMEKAAVVLLTCLLKAQDAFEEVFEGRMQQKRRLDCSGKMMTVRILVVLCGMMLTLVLGGSLLQSVIVANLCEVVAIAVLIAMDRPIIDFEKKSHGTFALWQLMAVCLPVCLANLLSFYLTNAPKYAIDGFMDETAQAKYNFIAMPVFIIQLMNMFIYQPVLVKMAIAWTSEDYRKFTQYFRKIMLALAGIAAVVLLASWLFGIPVLSLLYATDLTDLRIEFMIIMVSSIFLALSGFYNALLTVMRHQNAIPPVYVIGSILSLLLTSAMVRRQGIYGAVMAYLLIMVLVSAMLFAVYEICLHKAMKQGKK
jgi:O-antigen/teichoic acid export membrane protein